MDEKRRLVPITESQPYKLGVNPHVAPPFTFVQSTRTRGHAWPSAARAITDLGGDFSTVKIKSFSPGDVGIYKPSAFGLSYEGREYAVNPNEAVSYALSMVPLPSESLLEQRGATAIARCLPTNPVADAGTFIGELKAGLPRLVGKELFKTKFKDYRKVGSEYLNVEFGWKPIVSDLQKFGKATIESEKILKQLQRDSGRNIRRRFTFPEDRSVTTSTFSGLSRIASGGGTNVQLYRSSGAPLVRTVETVTKTWFSGCFTYYLDLGSDLQSKVSRAAAEARKLYGVELTPATVWNLAPWSWAVDWEGNVGDVLHNVSRFSQDGLVMRYGYIMQETTCKVDWTLDYRGRLRGTPMSSLTLSVTSQRKERRRASPFGFGFNMTALTGRQLSILGALGISRGPRHL